MERCLHPPIPDPLHCCTLFGRGRRGREACIRPPTNADLCTPPPAAQCQCQSQVQVTSKTWPFDLAADCYLRPAASLRCRPLNSGKRSKNCVLLLRTVASIQRAHVTLLKKGIALFNGPPARPDGIEGAVALWPFPFAWGIACPSVRLACTTTSQRNMLLVQVLVQVFPLPLLCPPFPVKRLVFSRPLYLATPRLPQPGVAPLCSVSRRRILVIYPFPH